jgi:molecular chaperone DnaJ
MDLYLVLGVKQAATPGEIRRAYRRLARRFHPDINPGDRVVASRFEKILRAYETLIDPVRRSRYDVGGEGVLVTGHAGGSGFEGFDFSEAGNENTTTFGDLFAEVIAERTKSPSVQRGVDLHGSVSITFEQSLEGTRCPVTVTRQAACRSCSGHGAAATSTEACLLCRGTGTVHSSRRHMVFSRTCPTCSGSGLQRPGRCGLCGGSGLEIRSEKVVVDVPPGIDDGERVRVTGLGHAGAGGGQSGDLYLSVQVAAHPAFQRQGDDLHVVLLVSVPEAAFGARIEVSAPGGGITLRVPPGTQSGQLFRLRGRGAVSRGAGGKRGDLVVEARLMLPPILDERSKELLREFDRINDDNVRDDAGERYGG